MNTDFKVTGLTRPGIKPESAAPEADALTAAVKFEINVLICKKTNITKRFYIITNFS